MANDVRSADRSAAEKASLATYAAFIASGASFSTWASRIPQVQTQLALSPQTLGLVLLALAAGSVLALPLAGILVGRIGSSRTVQLMAVVNGTALLGIGVGHTIGVAPLVIGLFCFGFAQGAWDVAMNVQGAAVERTLGRSIMARYHAGFSVGTVAGALLSALLVVIDVPAWIQLPVVGMVIAVLTPFAVRAFLPDNDREQADPNVAGAPRRHPLAAWTEPRTLLVGLFVLAFAFTEGTANDWVAVALIRDLQASEAIGTLGFAIFLSAMTLSRWVGPRLQDRYGRVAVIRAVTVVALIGVGVFVFTTSTVLAVAATALWGLGAGLGFPMGMSAAADEPRFAAGRVSVVASIGYTAFLAGPPLIGFLGEQIGVQKGLVVVPVLLVIALLIAGCVRPPQTVTSQIHAGADD